MIVKESVSVMDYEELEQIKLYMSETDEVLLKKGDIKSSLSFRFAKYLLISGFRNVIDIMDSFFSIVFCGLWSYDTYNDGSQEYIEYIIQMIITLMLIFFFFINIFASDNKIMFALSIHAALDYLTLLPTLLYNIGVVTGPVFAFWRVVRIICCLRLESVLSRKNLLIGKTIYRLIITLFSLIFISGAAILEIDNYYIRNLSEGQKFNQKSDLSLLSFHDMLYFMIVTISTVGYGDISPRHDVSKVIVVFTLLLMLALIPAQTQDLIKVTSLSSSYTRISYQSHGDDTHHLLLMGDVSFNTIRMFLEEFYHQDHGASEIHMILMQSTPPTEDFVGLLNLPQYESRVIYLQGNWMNFHDLKRCMADRIDCGIILSKMSTQSPMLEDYKNILRAFSIKKYGAVKGRKSVRIALQLLKPQNKAIFNLGRGLSSFDQVICAEELKLQLIAKSCVCPGIITLISTLITSGVPPLSSEDASLWQNQWALTYLLGMQHEVYRVRLDGVRFGGYRYSDVCRALYAAFNIIVVAIEVPVGSNERQVFVHPSNYVLSSESYYTYVINTELPDVERINALNMAEAGFQKYEPSRISAKELDEMRKKGRTKTQADMDECRQNYYLLKRPAQQEEAALYKADYRKIENHVIICGLVSSIEYFILALRTKIMGGSRPPIIIMTTEQIKTEIWKKINLFEDVYFIRGSPLNPADLERASINRAIGVVILSEEISNGKKVGSKNTKEAEAIFIYKTIKNMNTRAFVVIELSNMSKVSFLLSSKNPYTAKYGNIMSEPFAAGEVFIPSLLDALMCQAFYLPYIMQIIQQFIMGNALTPADVLEVYKKMDLAQSALFLLDMSPDLVNQKYFSCVFDKCVAEKGMLPIGLYKADPGNPKPYVLLSPPDDTPISSNDKLFVLSEYNPLTLQDGNMMLGKPATMEATKLDAEDASVIVSKLKGETGRLDMENAKQLHAIEKRMADLLAKTHTISAEAEESQDAWESLIGDHVRLFVRNKNNVQYQ